MITGRGVHLSCKILRHLAKVLQVTATPSIAAVLCPGLLQLGASSYWRRQPGKPQAQCMMKLVDRVWHTLALAWQETEQRRYGTMHSHMSCTWLPRQHTPRSIYISHLRTLQPPTAAPNSSHIPKQQPKLPPAQRPITSHSLQLEAPLQMQDCPPDACRYTTCNIHQQCASKWVHVHVQLKPKLPNRWPLCSARWQGVHTNLVRLQLLGGRRARVYTPALHFWSRLHSSTRAWGKGVHPGLAHLHCR